LKFIAITGAAKGTGKTSMAAAVVKNLPGLSVIKCTVHSTEKGEQVIIEPEILRQPATDTGRLLAAGAERVIWIRSAKENLGSSWKRALGLLPKDAQVIVEGNSVLEYFHPDFNIFMVGSSLERMKPYAWKSLATADVVISNCDGHRCEALIEELRQHDIKAPLFALDARNPDGKILEQILGALKSALGR